jgi:hypothetical protein
VNDWTLDEYKHWNLHHAGVHLSIEPRPHSDHRGHYLADVEGIGSIDVFDGFPRYFMSLERAKAEMREWLLWRLAQQPNLVPSRE